MQEEKGWQFIYLGANQDAIQEGGSFGIQAANAINYQQNEQGFKMAYRCATESVTSYRTSD